MKEKPILFSGPMVKAILAGRKTQTRRVIKTREGDEFDGKMLWRGDIYGEWHPIMDYCPYHNHMLLWVRETWMPCDTLQAWDIPEAIAAHEEKVLYRADVKGEDTTGWGWKSPLFMPRWASRLTLEIVNVKVERVQDISEEDARDEGIDIELRDMSVETRDYSREDEWFQSWGNDASLGYTNYVPFDQLSRSSFRTLWDSINAERGYGWEVNPWVWAIEFKKVEL